MYKPVDSLDYFTPYDIRWLSERIDKIPHFKERLKVSEWAQANRNLPDELTHKPGFWDNSYTPYLVEIMDRLSMDSNCMDLVVMKSAQVGASVGIGENFIGYVIGHNPGGILYVNADQQMAEMTAEMRVDALIEHSGLTDKIRSARKSRGRVSGNTAKKKDFVGGFFMPLGARSTTKLRSTTAKNAIIEEVDDMKRDLRGQGHPADLIWTRQKTFTATRTRKTLYISTPLIMQTSYIYDLFLQGDQRFYFVPCLECGKMQVMVFSGKTEDGESYGIEYHLDDDNIVIPESVSYRCKFCKHKWREEEKILFTAQGEWRPTARPQRAYFHSYHVSALYSPSGMYQWVDMVYKHALTYDIKLNKVKDIIGYKTFIQLETGWPWEERGEAPDFHTIIHHKRAIYTRNEIPNTCAIQETGSPILLLTCAADVHKNRIDVEIIGWCAGSRSYSIDWRHLEGPADDLQGAAWNALRKLIEEEVWEGNDGKKYKVIYTLIDARYATDFV